MIKATRPDFNNLESQREKTICLQYILSDSSIPSALAYKVIGAAVIAWPLKEEKDKPCLYHKAAVLNVTEDDELRIWVDDNRVNVYLTNKKSLLSISPDAAASIQECLTKNIESSLIFYHSSFGGTLNPTRVSELYYMEIGIPCGSETCFISSLEVTKTNKWTCKNGKEHKTNYVRYWVFDKSQKTCSVGCAGLTDIELQTQPSDKHLVRLGSQIEHGISEGIRSMALKQWKTCNLSKLKDPTLKDLSDALQKVKLDSHLVCQIFREKMDLVEYAELNLQADPTDQHLKELSNQIGNCPLQLGIELGLSFTEVEQNHSYRIYNRKNNGQIGSQLKYVVNVYNTTSLINVNGSRVELFVNGIFKDLCAYLTKHFDSFDILNNEIANYLEDISTNYKDKDQNSDSSILKGK
ncbi:unnamed protein product [Mytilus edulis]|uniref:Uncharacterized protein n=1 Tax=Mytilus edulis TaxID=6550 RepID=A0A8S3SMR2_MYTED|nr:unnamed protein product [Mytilus edulis]